MTKPKTLYAIATIFVLVFCVNTALDYHTYTTTLNSAPFRFWVLVNGIYFLVPAALSAAIGALHSRRK